MALLLIPLDEAVVFPAITATLPIDTGEEDRVFLLPRQDGDFGRIGVVAEVIERGEQAGVHRCTFYIPPSDRGGTERALDELAAAIGLG